MKYVCLGYYNKGEREGMTGPEQDAMFDECFDYDDHLRANGHWAWGEALAPAETALTVYWKNGKVATTDGPYAETKEQIGGILILEARDMNHAVQLMAQHPAIEYGSIFEIRPAADMSELVKASEVRRGKNTSVRSTLLSALLVIGALGASRSAAAQSAKQSYASMAPVEQYLMDRGAEIALARSAAPNAISRDAQVLVLARHGYETAVPGKNGWVCMVERGWMGPFDSPEFWSPKVRGAVCLNPPAARSMLPFANLRTEMLMTGHSKAEVIAAIEASLGKKKWPGLERGAVAYMMSKSSYLTDNGDHNGPHLMFYEPVNNDSGWGAGVPDSPVVSVDYWRLSAQAYPQVSSFPPIRVFAVAVDTWSDGTPAPSM
jgi:hypothetical protein